MKQVVLGAGPLGVALGDLLGGEGHEVHVHSIMADPAYDMVGTNPAKLDGTDAAAVQEACRGADVAYLLLNAHYVDWYEEFPPRLAAAINATAATGTALIYHDTLHMYRPGPAPLTEDSPHDASSRKGRLLHDLATTFLAAVSAGRIRGAVGRSADMYGPGALNSSHHSTLGQRHFYPMLAGKTVSIVGDIDQPHTYAFVGDVARGLATLGANEAALGRVWHLPAAPTLTHRELVTLAFEVAGRAPKLRGSKVSGFVVRIIGRFQKDVAEVAEILDSFEQPLIMSHHGFADAFGDNATPHRDALEQTIGWYRANPLG